MKVTIDVPSNLLLSCERWWPSNFIWSIDTKPSPNFLVMVSCHKHIFWNKLFPTARSRSQEFIVLSFKIPRRITNESSKSEMNLGICIIISTRCTNFSNFFLERNSTCFGRFFCPSSRVFHCTHGNGICHTGFANCQQTCMTYTIAVFTVKNSWWWTVELSETCRVNK